MTTNGNEHKPHPTSIEELEHTVLLCRDISHAWTAHNVVIGRRQRIITRTLICANCGCLRHQELTITGHLIPGRSRSENPPDYLLVGAGRMTSDTKAAIRLLSSKILQKGGQS